MPEIQARRARARDERLDLADVAAAVGSRSHRFGPPAVLLATVITSGRMTGQPVALDEPLARLVVSRKKSCVSSSTTDLEPELGDHVHEHRDCFCHEQ
jgi:hypothetical protein